ncbi:hypothetical protein, partial [Marinospirillum sp.]|uniref:hypothetical protein n=1 Tax=Marinospirillum sp. TaxID=2183934 RepID=UPI0025BF776B
ASAHMNVPDASFLKSVDCALFRCNQEAESYHSFCRCQAFILLNFYFHIFLLSLTAEQSLPDSESAL